MEIYVNAKIAISFDMSFKSITILTNKENTNGIIRFDNSHYITVADKNLIGDGYIDLYYGVIYWRNTKYEQYTSKDADTMFFKDYEGNDTFCKVTYYDSYGLSTDKYSFYVEATADANGIIHTELRCMKKKQIRPSDMSQDWVDTEEVRDDPNCEVIYDSCECGGMEFQWIFDGYLCDGINKCERLKYQYKDSCVGEWKDYSPTLYKIGKAVELNSSECNS